ncbi:MAG TPA: glycosyltransferase, partial [Bacteroidales bacterium]|nr:glycosyltransferase [Bacteroidales bacterium]
MTATMNYHNILISIFVVSAAVQFFYYWYFFSRLAFHRKKMTYSGNPEPVSVVICAHNESENLQKNLPEILNQDYPDFEVVVVNDGSTDDSETMLLEFSNRYKHLKVINIKNSVT